MVNIYRTRFRRHRSLIIKRIGANHSCTEIVNCFSTCVLHSSLTPRHKTIYLRIVLRTGGRKVNREKTGAIFWLRGANFRPDGGQEPILSSLR